MRGCLSLTFRRWLLPLAVMCSLLASTGAAWGWIEKEIESSAVTVDVDPNGLAKIHFSIALGVRGQRLRGLTLHGIDLDASPLPDGTITRMIKGRASSLPLPLNVIANAGKLEITLPLSKGFRGRHFKLEFAYRTHFLEQGKIQSLADGLHSAIAWTSPRYPNGVDAASVTFRLPTSSQPPTVGSAPEGTTFGIVMSHLRRTQSQDELELVRAHLAQGESMIWRTQISRDIFGPKLAPTPKAGLPVFVRPTPPTAVVEPKHATQGLFFALFGLLYALLVAFKSRCLHTIAKLNGCTARGLLPLSSIWRALGAGGLLTVTTAVTIWSNTPWLSSTLLLCTLAFASHRPPQHRQALRSGGSWRNVDINELTPKMAGTIAGSWLDASRTRGLLVLLGLLSGTTALASHWYSASPYLGAAALCASALLLPIFCTGLSRDLPRQRLIEMRRLLSKAYRYLINNPELRITVLGRFTQADNQLDELRLSIVPQKGLTGLMSLEVAVEIHDDWTGGQALPVVLIRAADSSPCYRALPRQLSWRRGRSAEERAAIVRPQCPTSEGVATLVHQVLGQLHERVSNGRSSKSEATNFGATSSGAVNSGTSRQRSKKTSKSRGNAVRAAKAGTSESPAHAT